MKVIPKYLTHLIFAVICGKMTISNSYVIVEPDKSGGNLFSSFLEQEQTLQNELNTKSSFSQNSNQIADRTINSIQTKNAEKNVNQLLKSCSTCNTNHKSIDILEERDKERVEYIKQQILAKLGMNKEPNIDSANINADMYMQLLETSLSATQIFKEDSTYDLSSAANFNSNSDKLFIFPVTNKYNKSVFNLTLFTSSFDVTAIKNIVLSVKRKLSHYNDIDDNKEITIVSVAVQSIEFLTTYQGISNMSVLEIVKPMFDVSNAVSNATDKQTQNWLQYNITSLLKRNIINNRLIYVDKEGIDSDNSFITIEHYNTNVMRMKRSVDCNGNATSCCRESFYVNFTQIGWHNWILQPTGYYANYCKGKCDISHARYHHTSVIGKYPLISLCCSPREMSHISLIYVDDNGYVFQKNLPNMVVESCDCA